MTLDARLDAVGGRPSGFDYLRLSLSVLVIVSHSFQITMGRADGLAIIGSTFIRPFNASILPMFFALSGFLVAGSLSRTKTLVMFLGLRGIRIFPALAVEILLSAFLLGVIFTTLPLSEYFTDRLFFRYLLNVTGHISFFLPGVFETNPDPRYVNAQLWTIPWELYCYITISVLMAIGVVRRPILLIIGAVLMEVLFFGQAYVRDGSDALFGAPALPHVQGFQLVIAFLGGVGFYLYRGVVPWSRALGIAAGLAMLLLLAFRGGEYLVALPAAYFTVYLGLTNADKLGVIKGADYSYGIYLYGFPIQQAVAATGEWSHVWYVNLVVSLVIVSGFAAFSWHYVEKPALGLRSTLKIIEARWLAFRARPTDQRAQP